MKDRLVDQLLVLEPQLHLRGVHVHVQETGIDGEMQQRERVFMLHHERLVGLLDGLRDQAALYISSVYVVIFIVAVAPGDHRLSDEAAYAHRRRAGFQGNQIGGDLPAKHGVDHVL